MFGNAVYDIVRVIKIGGTWFFFEEAVGYGNPLCAWPDGGPLFFFFEADSRVVGYGNPSSPSTPCRIVGRRLLPSI
jgi:hypothetical protein